MAAPEFTAEQRAAIERRDGPLLLAAGAGSGKTSVLVERFVRFVVEDGIPPGRILAVTFTDKAAGELRARIRRRLLDMGERRLAQDAETAWIGTIHGFCTRVLRAHAVAAGLDPAFEVLGEPEARELRGTAFQAALGGLLGDPGGPPRPDALDLVAAYGVDRLEGLVRAVHDELRSAGQRHPVLPAAPPAPDTAALRAALATARDAAAGCLEGGELKTVLRARAALERCAGMLAGPDPAPLAVLEAAAFSAGNTAALKADPCTAYLGALERYAAACRARAAGGALALLGELLDHYGAAYEAAKREASAVDFDDLELLVADLLDGSPALRRAWAGRFDRIMVDEFQDTNPLQVALLERIDRGATFVVGDELQSIYGFRHASLEGFRAVRAAREAAGELTVLARNFRGRPELLAALNVATAPLHDRRYEPLVPGREDAPAAEPLVELLVTDHRNGEWDDVDLGVLPGAQRWRWAEARLLAQRIDELVRSGRHSAGDVVVLLRAITDIATYERALEDRGLTTLAMGGGGFWARQQVQDLTGYLAALVNPLHELALLGVLASPLGPALSSDGLARCVLAARESDRSIWRTVGEPDTIVALPTADRERLARWHPGFAAERARAGRMPLAELLERAIAASGYDEHVLRLPGGLRRLANVRKLVRLAAAFEADNGRDVRGFIDRATAELEAEAREPDAPVELGGLDAVRLMTIHAAKGMEFPVVAVADLGRGPNNSQPDLLVDGGRIGLRLVTMDGKGTALEYDALAEERHARGRAEELRVFHVGMTRAEERLILSGAANVEKWPNPDGKGSPPIAWLGPAFVPNLAERLQAEPLIEERRDGLWVRAMLNSPATVGRVLEARSVSAAGPTAPEPTPGGPPSASGSGRERPSGVGPRASGPAAPVAAAVQSLSYSALSDHARCGYRFYLERVLRMPKQAPPPMAEQLPGFAGLDPLVRGTIAHELLERVDLEAPSVPADEAIRAAGAAHDTELADADVADLRALLDGALASDVLRRAAAARSRHVEHPFALALGGEHHLVPLITGVVDLLAWEDGGAALVLDYKTDRLDGAEPEAVVAAGYAIQRRIYALAALRAGAVRVEVAHLFLERPDRPATATYAAADVPRLEAEVAALARPVLEGSFEVTDRPHRELCATCPGRGGLCSWPEAEVLRRSPA